MKVIVNNEELNIFEGAKVKDAIIMYFVQQGKDLPMPIPTVKDAYGHKIGFYGSLLPNMVLYIDENKK